MTDQTPRDPVDEYLDQLRTAVRLAPHATRDEYVSEISQHIAEGREHLDPNDRVGLRELLAQVGDPVTLAHDFYQNQGIDASRGWRRFGIGQRIAMVAVPLGAILLLGLGVGVLAWVDHYQPLTEGGEGSIGPLGPHGVPLRPLPVSSGAQPFTIPVYAMPRGTSTVRIPVYLYNTGGRSLTVTDIESPATYPHVFGPASYAYEYSGKGTPVGPTTFPFTLGGHQWLEVVLSVPMHCTAVSGEYVEFTRVRVTTSFFGVTHGVWLNVGKFVIQFAKSC